MIIAGLALRLSQLREVVGLLWSARLKWHNLGLELGIHETELKVIQANHPNDVEACFTEMLSHWLKMIQPAPSYQALVEACSRPSVKCYKLASEIAKKHDIGIKRTNQYHKLLNRIVDIRISYIVMMA